MNQSVFVVVPAVAIEYSSNTWGLQQSASVMDGVQVALVGLHWAYKIITHPKIQRLLRPTMIHKNHLNLGVGFKIRTKRAVTPSFGRVKDRMPGVKDAVL